MKKTFEKKNGFVFQCLLFEMLRLIFKWIKRHRENRHGYSAIQLFQETDEYLASMTFYETFLYKSLLQF